MIFMNQVLTSLCRYLCILNRKNSHENFLVFSKKPIFFYLLLACPTPNSVIFFSGQFLSLNVNHSFCQFFQTVPNFFSKFTGSHVMGLGH